MRKLKTPKFEQLYTVRTAAHQSPVRQNRQRRAGRHRREGVRPL